MPGHYHSGSLGTTRALLAGSQSLRQQRDDEEARRKQAYWDALMQMGAQANEQLGIMGRPVPQIAVPPETYDVGSPTLGQAQAPPPTPQFTTDPVVAFPPPTPQRADPPLPQVSQELQGRVRPGGRAEAFLEGRRARTGSAEDLARFPEQGVRPVSAARDRHLMGEEFDPETGLMVSTFDPEVATPEEIQLENERKRLDASKGFIKGAADVAFYTTGGALGLAGDMLQRSSDADAANRGRVNQAVSRLTGATADLLSRGSDVFYEQSDIQRREMMGDWSAINPDVLVREPSFEQRAGQVVGSLAAEATKYIAGGSLMRAGLRGAGILGPATKFVPKHRNVLMRWGESIKETIKRAGIDVALFAPVDVVTTRRDIDSSAYFAEMLTQPEMVEKLRQGDDGALEQMFDNFVIDDFAPWLNEVAAKAVQTPQGRAGFEAALGGILDLGLRTGWGGLRTTGLNPLMAPSQLTRGGMRRQLDETIGTRQLELGGEDLGIGAKPEFPDSGIDPRLVGEEIGPELAPAVPARAFGDNQQIEMAGEGFGTVNLKPLLDGEESTPLTVKSGKVTLRDVGSFLADRAKAHWGRVLDLKTDQELIARALADEVQQVLDAPGGAKANASEWYRETLEKAMQVVGRARPAIQDDPIHLEAFRFALAVTSNGQRVKNNAKLALEVYDDWAKTGRFNAKLGWGKEAKAMRTAWTKWNEMADELGEEDWLRLLDTKATVAELRKFGLEIADEVVSEVVPGSTVLGAKIGGSFYRNLGGMFDTVTMDRWFRRTIGRITGDMMEAPGEKALKDSADRFINNLQPEDYRPLGYNKKTLKNLNSEESAAARLEVARATRSRWEKTRKQLASDGLSKEELSKAKPEWAYAAERYIANYDVSIRDIPRSGSERSDLRAIMTRVQEMLGGQHDVASIQAMLWYPEKRLYTLLGVSGKKQQRELIEGGVLASSDEVDYETAFREIFDDRTGNESARLARNELERGAERQASGLAQAESTGFRAGLDDEGLARVAGKLRGAARRDVLRERRIAGREGDTGSARVFSRGVEPRSGSALGEPSHRLTPNSAESSALNKVGISTPDVLEVTDAQAFYRAVKASKEANPYGPAVTLYEPEQYATMRLFMTEDGSAVFALDGDDIVSVAKHPDSPHKGWASYSLRLATEEGGTRLDAYDGMLTRVYAQSGFQPTGRTKFNTEYMPSDWDLQRMGEPDVVAMRYDAVSDGRYYPDAGKRFDDYNDMIADQKARARGQVEETKLKGPGEDTGIVLASRPEVAGGALGLIYGLQDPDDPISPLGGAAIGVALTAGGRRLAGRTARAVKESENPVAKRIAKRLEGEPEEVIEATEAEVKAAIERMDAVEAAERAAERAGATAPDAGPDTPTRPVEGAKATDHADIDPDEFVNISKFGLTPGELEEMLEAAIRKVVAETGMDPKKVFTWEQTKALARSMGIDPDDLATGLDKQKGAMGESGARLLAVRNVIRANTERMAYLYKKINEDPKLEWGSEEAAVWQREIEVLDGEVNKLLASYMPAMSEAGRVLNAAKIMAQNTMDPAVWLTRAKRIAGGAENIPADIKIEIERLAKEKDKAGLIKLIGELNQSGIAEQVATLSKAFKLSGIPTQLMNLASTFVHVAFEEAKDIPASLIDRYLVATGQATERTKSFGSVRARLNAARLGAIDGFHNALEVMKGNPLIGQAEKWDQAKYHVNIDLAQRAFGDIAEKLAEQTPLLRHVPEIPKWIDAAAQGFHKTVFGALGAGDAMLTHFAVRRSLAEQARVQAINKGFKGADVEREAAKILQGDIPVDMMMEAIGQGELATFRTRGKTARMITGGKRQLATTSKDKSLNKGTRVLAGSSYVVTEEVAPFVQTPINVAGRIVEASPAMGAYRLAELGVHGASRAAEVAAPKLTEGIHEAFGVKPLKYKNGQQKAVVESLARATTAMPLIAAGWYMYGEKLMSLGYTPEKAGQRQLTGEQENSWKVGDNYISLERLSPIGNLMLMGGYMRRAWENSGDPDVMNPFLHEERTVLERAIGVGGGADAFGESLLMESAEGAARSLLEQTFLTGVRELLDAVSRTEREGAKTPLSPRMFASAAVPNIIRRMDRYMDPVSRMREDPSDYLRQAVPGASIGLPPRRDPFGQEIRYEREGTSPLATAYRTMIDPLQTSPDLTTDADGNLNLRGLLRELDVNVAKPRRGEFETPQEFDERQIIEGAELEEALSNFVRSPRFNRISRPNLVLRSEAFRELEASGHLNAQNEERLMDALVKALQAEAISQEIANVRSRQAARKNARVPGTRGLTLEGVQAREYQQRLQGRER